MWALSFPSSSFPNFVFYFCFDLGFLSLHLVFLPFQTLKYHHLILWSSNIAKTVRTNLIIRLPNLLKLINLFSTYFVSLKLVYSHLFSQLHNCPCSLVCPHWHKRWRSAEHWIQLWGTLGEADELQIKRQGYYCVIPKSSVCWCNVIVK